MTTVRYNGRVVRDVELLPNGRMRLDGKMTRIVEGERHACCEVEYRPNTGERCYLAMPVTSYGPIEETRTTAYLIDLGYVVVSPNTPEHDAGYKAEGMAYFERLVETCEVLAYLRFPDRTIGAGVGKEIATAIAARKPVLTVNFLKGQLHIDQIPEDYGMPGPILTVEETTAKIAAIRVERAEA